MKRAVALLTVLLTVFIAAPCSAAGGFYCEYTPKSEKSTIFYIDLYTTEDVAAAVMELSYDNSFVEYREVSAVEKSSSVRANNVNNVVKIAFAESKAVKGKLCRVAFKAVQAGTCSFTLHISQAADAEPKLLSGFPDSTIDVKLGKDDVVSDSSSKSSSKGEKSGSSSRSSLKESSESDVYIDPVTGEIIDLRKDHTLKYILIGAGITVLIAALVFAGVVLGRKTAKQSKSVKDDKLNESEPAEDLTNGENPKE